MKINDTLKLIEKQITSRQISSVIRLLRDVVYSHMSWGLVDELQNIQDTYSLMVNAIKNGQKDPALKQNYLHLLRKLYHLYVVAKWHHRNEQCKMPTLIGEQHPILDVKDMMQRLQNLKEHNTIEHRQYVDELFLILTNQVLWSEDTMKQMQMLLLSDEIDIIDQQILVTAIMLGAMNTFDVRKTICMMTVFCKTKHINLRARALVGWVMSLNDNMETIYPEQRQMVKELLEADKNILDELLQMQLQMIYCLSTLLDNNIINEEILPDIINKKNNGHMPNFDIRIIDEIEDIDDFLTREENEKQMEELADQAERIMDMQKQGSDVYFGGFAAMKNFPFFSILSNWFCPFYYEHPTLLTIDKGNVPDVAIKGLLSAVPFCDSDKYSFALAINMVLEKIPPKMLKLLGQGEIKDVSAIDGIPQKTILMRNYLQDLYRFFRLSPHRKLFVDVFSDDKYLFIVNPLFSDTPLLKRSAGMVTRLMVKKHIYGNLSQLQIEYKDYAEDKTYLCAIAQGCMDRNFPLVAMQYYALLYKKDETNKFYLSRIARCYFLAEKYENALEFYNKLEDLYPNEWKLQLNKSICQTYLLEENADALQTLSRLYYEHPSEIDVVRALAWSYLMGGKPALAQKKYKEVFILFNERDTTTDKTLRQDYLNFALSLWLDGKIGEALQYFALYLKASDGKENIEEILLSEQLLLSRYKVSSMDFCILTDLIYNENNNN